MKWFFGVVVLLNLLVALWGNLKTHPPGDIHAQEISPHSIRLLPADWGENTLKPSTDASAATATPAQPTKLIANLDPANASALLAKPDPKPQTPPAAKAADKVKVDDKPAASAKAETASAKAQAKVDDKPAASTKAEAGNTKAQAQAEPAAAACYDWGELDGHTLARIKPELAALKLTAREQAGAAGPGGKFWVYYPAQDQAKSAELKAKGFDNYQVQNEGEFKGALSLGLFTKEDGAKALLAKLKGAGFANGQLAQRGGIQRATLSFTRLTPQQSARLHQLQQRMAPSVALKPATCS